MSRFPTSCVVDASVGIKLFLPEEHSEDVQNFFAQCFVRQRSCLFVPDLFFVECANILWKKIRRGEYNASRATANLAALKGFSLSTTSTAELMERALEIACAHDITAYDACYVALGELKGVPLLTADSRLTARLSGTSHEVITLCPPT
ncbi:MAG: type II toxin-antitoxin system VapC family toxin [Armatimonadetes bacterium]|nr:type II toxin-antitoxin system VapC family toxin [Armatimonadota bacterium]